MIIIFNFFFHLDDPMLKYLTNKPSDSGNRTSNSNQAPAKPRYRGPEPQKNRYTRKFFQYEILFIVKYILYLDLTFGLVIVGMVLIDQMVTKENYLNQLQVDMLKLKKLIYGVLKICRLYSIKIFSILNYNTEFNLVLFKISENLINCCCFLFMI